MDVLESLGDLVDHVLDVIGGHQLGVEPGHVH